jgi:Trp operon repressor
MNFIDSRGGSFFACRATLSGGCGGNASAAASRRNKRQGRPIQAKMGGTAVIKVSPAQRQELEGIVARSCEGAGLVRRARVILMSADDVSDREIAWRLDLSAEAVSRGSASGDAHGCRLRRAH